MFKRLVALFFALVLMFSLVGCESEEEKTASKIEEYKGKIEGFLDALTDDDYDKAKTYLYSKADSSFDEYCKSCETEMNFDFSNGYKILKYYSAFTGESESSVEGTVYFYDVRINFGDFESVVTLQILDDGEKAGITIFEISPRM